ncbi:MAG: glycosyltransferase [Planctomycetes bacterium]|nr:glycosyltransferase [Planctomycetota bacterium]
MKILLCFPLPEFFDGTSALILDFLQFLRARGDAVDGAALIEGRGDSIVEPVLQPLFRRLRKFQHPLVGGALPRFSYRVGNRLRARTPGGRHFVPPGYLRWLRTELPLADYDVAVTVGSRFCRVRDLVRCPVIADIHDYFTYKAELLRGFGHRLQVPFVSRAEEIATMRPFDAIWCPSHNYRTLLAAELPAQRFIDRHLSIASLLPEAGAAEASFREECARPRTRPRLLFVGSTALENRPGLFLFLREIWPAIRARVPGAELHVIGWRAEELPEGDGRAGIVAHGKLPARRDVLARYAATDVVVIPRMLDGLTTKGVEALALGMATVGHPLAFSGCYRILSWEQAVIAESSAEFAAAVTKLLEDAALRARIGSAAARFARERFSPQAAYEGFDAAVRQLRAPAPPLGSIS